MKLSLAQLTFALSRLLEAHPEFAEELVHDTWLEVDGRDVDLEAYL